MKPTLEALPSHVPLSCLLPLLNASTAQIKCRGPRASDWRQRIKRRCPRASGLPNHVPLLTYCLVLKPQAEGAKAKRCMCASVGTYSLTHLTSLTSSIPQRNLLLYSTLYSTPSSTRLHHLLYFTLYYTPPATLLHPAPAASAEDPL